MAPAPSSSSTAAATAAVVVTDPSPSVAPAVPVVAFAPAMGAIKVSSSAARSGSSTSPRSSASGKSDVSNSAADQESSSEPFIRSLSGSKLNAKAPEFVPKGISQPSVPGLPGLLSVSSLPILGVRPIHCSEPLFSPSQFDLMPAVVASSPPAVTSGASPPDAPEYDEALLPQDSSPPLTQTTAPVPHPKQITAISEELKAKIIKQVEFYFSDQNLPTDNFLMKFVKKDPDGFVPIPVVASFRKIKNLVKNHAVVANALRDSTLLVVSDDGKKVRRVHPLPEVDLEEVQSRTVVAENLPEDHSIESVEQLFGSVGTVKMVRICQPEAANGASQTAAKFKSDMVVSNKLHALVEFETIEQAEKAVVSLTDQRNWRSGLRVRLLLRRTFQSKHGFQQSSFQKGRKTAGDESGGEDDGGAEDKAGEDCGHQNNRSEDAPGNDAAGAVDRDAGGRKGKGRGRGRGMPGRGKGQHGGPHHHIGSNGSRNHQLGTSPQTSHSPIASDVVGRPPPGPRMPDGTRGFTLGRGKLPIMGSA